MTSYIQRIHPLLLACIVWWSCDGPETVQSVDQALCSGQSNVEGVDVSCFQNVDCNQPRSIDWNAVKTSGKSFVIAKASEGTTFVDPAFSSNWSGIRAAGFTRGAYHFFRGGVDGVAQADHYLAVVNANGGFQSGDLPPAVDLETIGLTGNVASDITRFRDTLNRAQSLTGRQPIIYTNNDTWSRLGNPSGFETYPVWLANWFAQCTSLPPGLTNLKFWQYTDSGSVPGISGSVDRDVFNGTASDLLAFAGGSSIPTCGTGLFCSASQIPGASVCLSGAQTVYCCPSGQTIVNGACSGTNPFCSSNCGGGGWWCSNDGSCIVNGVPGHNYHCPGNNVAPDRDQACASGCVIAATGSPDYCKATTFCGGGAWCGNDCVNGYAKTLYNVSSSGSVLSVTHCEVGFTNRSCVIAPSGSPDFCN